MPTFDESVIVTDAAGKTTIRISGAGTTGGTDEPVVMRGQNADLVLGGGGAHGDLFVRNGAGEVTVHVDGQRGDVRLSGADCAEYFDVGDALSASPGAVLVLGEDGLEPCGRPYHHLVAGVVSGAGDHRPGIVLDAAPEQSGALRARVALVGKVYCRVDASYAPVELGDLLTMSATPGHAMKAVDREKAFGAVLGKSLGRLQTGRGLLPILVTLQ